MTQTKNRRKPLSQRSAEDPVPSLSAKEAVVLELLLASLTKEMYGLEMVASSGKQLKRGTVYVTLDRMEDKGYVKSRQEDAQPNASGIPRRLYQVTGYGQRAFEIWQMARELGRTRLVQVGGAS